MLWTSLQVRRILGYRADRKNLRTESKAARRGERRSCDAIAPARDGRLWRPSGLFGTMDEFVLVRHRELFRAGEPAGRHGGGGLPREPWTVALSTSLRSEQREVLPLLPVGDSFAIIAALLEVGLISVHLTPLHLQHEVDEDIAKGVPIEITSVQSLECLTQ